jgi:hypothetical protein
VQLWLPLAGWTQGASMCGAGAGGLLVV